MAARLVDHWVVRYGDEPGAYRFEIETADLAPGICSIRFVSQDGTIENVYVQLAAPAAK